VRSSSPLSFDDVTVPRPGSTTTRTISSEALRRTIAGLVNPDLSGLSPRRWAALQRVVRRVRGLARTRAGLVASVARRPNVGTLVSCLSDPTRADVDRDAVAAQLVGALAVELGAGTEPTQWEVDAFAPRFVAWAHRGQVALPPGASRLRVIGRRIEASVDGRATTVEPTVADDHGPLFAPIDDDVVLARADDNPLAHVEAHPDKAGNAIDLGGKELEAWTTALRDAVDLVRNHAPTLHADVRLLLQQVVPVGYDPERHVSASYADNLGTIYCSLHDDPMTMAEAIIHEVSHNKLNALLRLDPVLTNAFTCTVTSPIRPDPRPLHGVLLAVHAFVAVEHLYEAMRQAGHPWSQRPDFRRRHEEIRANNASGAATLREQAEATEVGGRLLAEFPVR